MSKEREVRTFTIDILCAKCGTFLYKYRKEGPGRLMKCYVDEILEDNTQGNLACPSCEQTFARERMIHGRPVHKIIQGKIRVKGHTGK